MDFWNEKTNKQLEEISLQLGALNSTIKEREMDDFNSKCEMDRKINVLLELLHPEDKILVDEIKLSDLLYDLTNYFKELQRESLCKDNPQELPRGTHEILDKLEKFNEYYKKYKKEYEKNRTYNILTEGGLDRTLY